MTSPKNKLPDLDQFYIREEPYYRSHGDEVALFEAAYADRIPVMLKGPTGVGTTLSLARRAGRRKQEGSALARKEVTRTPHMGKCGRVVVECARRCGLRRSVAGLAECCRLDR